MGVDKLKGLTETSIKFSKKGDPKKCQVKGCDNDSMTTLDFEGEDYADSFKVCMDCFAEFTEHSSKSFQHEADYWSEKERERREHAKRVKEAYHRHLRKKDSGRWIS